MINDRVIELAVAVAKPIEVLNLSTMSWNALTRWGIQTIADL